MRHHNESLSGCDPFLDPPPPKGAEGQLTTKSGISLKNVFVRIHLAECTEINMEVSGACLDVWLCFVRWPNHNFANTVRLTFLDVHFETYILRLIPWRHLIKIHNGRVHSTRRRYAILLKYYMVWANEEMERIYCHPNLKYFSHVELYVERFALKTKHSGAMISSFHYDVLVIHDTLPR